MGNETTKTAKNEEIEEAKECELDTTTTQSESTETSTISEGISKEIESCSSNTEFSKTELPTTESSKTDFSKIDLSKIDFSKIDLKTKKSKSAWINKVLKAYPKCVKVELIQIDFVGEDTEGVVKCWAAFSKKDKHIYGPVPLFTESEEDVDTLALLDKKTNQLYFSDADGSVTECYVSYLRKEGDADYYQLNLDGYIQ